MAAKLVHPKNGHFLTSFLHAAQRVFGAQPHVFQLFVGHPKPVKQVFEPNNPLADENGYVFASNVNEIEELIEMMDASRAYQNNIEVISTAKQLMSRTLDVIKV